jgi:predicted membrane protein DUF2254
VLLQFRVLRFGLLQDMVFSLTFVMVQFSAAAYSPRLVLWLAPDPVMSHATGVFAATFLYALAAFEQICHVLVRRLRSNKVVFRAEHDPWRVARRSIFVYPPAVKEFHAQGQ